MKMRKNLMGVVLAGALAAVTLSGCSNPQKAGTEALEAGDYEEAKTQFQSLAGSDDKDRAAAGYRGLGMTYYEIEDYTSALEAFQQADWESAKQKVSEYLADYPDDEEMQREAEFLETR